MGGVGSGCRHTGPGSRRSLRNASPPELPAGRTYLQALAVSGQPPPSRLAAAPAETKTVVVIAVYPLQLFCGPRWAEVFFQMISCSFHSQVLRGTHWYYTEPGNWVSEKQSFARLINSRIEVQAGEGNGKYSCLENPRDREAWWAAIYGVVQSPTQLKRLSSSSRGPSWCLKQNSRAASLYRQDEVSFSVK